MTTAPTVEELDDAYQAAIVLSAGGPLTAQVGRWQSIILCLGPAVHFLLLGVVLRQ